MCGGVCVCVCVRTCGGGSGVCGRVGGVGTNNVKTSSEYSIPPVAQRYN